MSRVSFFPVLHRIRIDTTGTWHATCDTDVVIPSLRHRAIFATHTLDEPGTSSGVQALWAGFDLEIRTPLSTNSASLATKAA